MARSLTVQQEETPRTSWLFVSFMALCSALLLLSWFTGAPADGSDLDLRPAVGQLP